MALLRCWVLFMVAMEARIISAELTPDVPNTCLDKKSGFWSCCLGYDQVGNMCVIWRCSNELHCSRGDCDTNTGRCICSPGWEGTKCELPCEFGKYGQNCMNECNCINGAECEPGNGNCVCLPGFIGNTCEQPCPFGTFGRYCREECDCLNGSPCSSVDGICICERGLIGDRCETCIPKLNSMQCFTFCNAICMNGGVCDTINKQCKCSTGYMGKHCEICNPTMHPDSCIKDCEKTLCANGATCNTDMRQCDCMRGWQGRSCNAPCGNEYYGHDCKKACNCVGLPCHHITGQCLSECPMGWRGDNCRQPCIEGSYGYQCTQKCTCKNGAQCDPKTGNCLCKDRFRGKNCEEKCPSGRGGINCDECLCESPLMCDDEFNKCVCPAGFTGFYCNQSCSEGDYGPSCYKHCSCHGNESCDAVSGVCNCKPGWTGEVCQSMCQLGTFGPGCSLTCPKCPDLNGCFHVNGSCDMCNPGFKGESCDVPCPSGFYGPSCLYTCTCNNGICNATNGACPQSYSQSPSTVGMNYVGLLEERSNDFPLFIVISASTLSFLLILMLTILIGTRIYKKGYKHGSRSSNNNLTDVVSMTTTNDNDGQPYNTRATVQMFTTSTDSGLCEFSTNLHKEGATPDIIASNSTSYPVDPDESSYTEVEINVCHSTSSCNEYLYTTPPALPAQNLSQTPSCDKNKNDDFYDKAYSSIETRDFKKTDDSEDNCYDILSEAETLPTEPVEHKQISQHQYYVLEPTIDDDYDSISDGETDVCLLAPNNYEDIAINTAGPSKLSDAYEEVKNPLVRHHTLDAVAKTKKNVYDLLGHSAKRRKRVGSEGSKLGGNNSNYGRLQKEIKAQTGYNELEFGPRKVRVGKTVLPTGNHYGSLNR